MACIAQINPERRIWAAALLAASLAASTLAQQPRRPLDIPDTTQAPVSGRTRLVLKDGSYQIVFSYKVIGDVVEYRSAERDGATEQIPLRLVDLPATERWYRQHVEGQAPADGPERPVLSPELAKAEADRAALTPEIAPNLRLPEELSVLALDTFEGTPELVPLVQEGSDLNKETAHATRKLALNPAAAPHRILEIPGIKSEIQLHVAQPVWYVRIGSDASEAQGGSFTVDTHGAGNDSRSARPTPGGGDARSGYVVERLDPRLDTRILDSFRIALLDTGRPQPDVIELRQEPLPGGHWLRLTPLVPLDFGEYALVEVLSGHELNLDVWDFGIHSAAKENAEAIRPEAPRKIELKGRPQH
jgi:hypothetical protein